MTPPYLPGMEHERRKPELSQWFTQPKLATRVWDWANRYTKPRSVLEPAAGQGALIKPIFAKPYECRLVTAIDIDASNVGILEILAQRVVETPLQCLVEHGDFSSFVDLWVVDGDGRVTQYDLALMNPPYEDGQAEAFILHALTVCKRVVGIFKASIRHGAERHRGLWSRCHVQREVKLMSRPSFGVGASGRDQAQSDFVVLEIHPGQPPRVNGRDEHFVMTEMWP